MKGEPITYEGKEYSLYQATQKQRQIETAMRKCKRELIVAEANGDDEEYTNKSVRLKRLEYYYNDFSDKAKLPKHELGNIPEFGPQEYDRAMKSANETQIVTSKSLEIDDFEYISEYNGIDAESTQIIGNTIKEYERDGGVFFSEVRYNEPMMNEKSLFETDISGTGLIYLRGNKKLLSLPIEEINNKIKNTIVNLPQNLREAVIHECGHSRAYYGKTVAEISEMNKELKKLGVPNISVIAEEDGAECIAEVEVLISRGESVPQDAMELYLKYTSK